MIENLYDENVILLIILRIKYINKYFNKSIIYLLL